AVTAARSEPAPLSVVRKTVKVLGRVRSSSTSRQGTKEGRATTARRPTRRPRAGSLRKHAQPDVSRCRKEVNYIGSYLTWGAVWVMTAGHPPRRAERAPGRCRAGGGLAWRSGPRRPLFRKPVHPIAGDQFPCSIPSSSAAS